MPILPPENKLRRDDELIDAKHAIEKDLISGGIKPMMIHYPVIIEAISELLEYRKSIRKYWENKK
jgi:hypothetical protein